MLVTSVCHTFSLDPRPRPAFCRLLFHTSNNGKLGGAWDFGTAHLYHLRRPAVQRKYKEVTTFAVSGMVERMICLLDGLSLLSGCSMTLL